MRCPICRLSKNYWEQVIRKQGLYFRREANHNHSHSTKTQGSKPASQHHCNGQDAELEARVSAIYAILRRRAWSPRLARFEVGIQQHYNIMPKREVRSPRFNYREALCLGYNCLHYWVNFSHVMRGVNPHCGGFLGDSFTPETPINSLVCYGKGENFWIRTFSWGILKSSTFLPTCWFQVFFAQVSLRFYLDLSLIHIWRCRRRG